MKRKIFWREVKWTTKFEALKAITDEQEFRELVFDLTVEYDSPNAFAKLLSKSLSENGLQKLQSIVRSDYPLSFDSRQ